MKPVKTLQRQGSKYLFYSATDKIHCFASILPFYDSVAKKYYKWKKYDVCSYAVPIEPFKRRIVNPSKITHITGYPNHGYPIKNMMEQFGNVITGDWDRSTKPFNDTMIIHRSLRQRYIDNLEWEETKYVQEALKIVEQGGHKWHNCSTKEEIKERCETIDNLYNDIKQNGFRTQKELNQRASFPNKLMGEVLIDISRDGELLFVDGKHRLSIAKILGLKQIPVTVMIRHKKWMESIDEAYKTKNLPDHPDVHHLY